MNRKYSILSGMLVAFFVLISLLVFREGSRSFSLGLDLVGGTELIYKADTSEVDDVGSAMESLREVIERRVNVFGVSEPLIQVESAGIVSGNADERLIVELPGISNIEEAKELIGQTPILEFRLEKPNAFEIIEANPDATLNDIYEETGLTGRYLTRARVDFDPNTQAPLVGLDFNTEGSQIFAKITRENEGKTLAIILDGTLLSAPVIQDEITNGQAQIVGSFTPDYAKEIVRNLNYGALPVPVTLLTSKTIGATLGEVALDSGVRAGIIGFVALSVFLMLWYRLPGVMATLALTSYIVLSLLVFKYLPVTLTAAGLAGFILSIGMAVDANVLIFERAKEELKKGKSVHEALHEGFSRAWLSIRDSNIASIITAVILFWIGTSAVKGFALTLGLGVVISMFTAITVSRTFLFAIASEDSNRSDSKFKRFLFSNGFHIK